MKVGVIGLGYWGPNLVRNLQSNSRISRVFVFDINPVRMELIKNKFPEVKKAPSVDDILSNEQVELVFIATPVNTHYDLALKALESDKHIWVEKPFTLNIKQAEELVNLSEKKV